MMMHGEVKVNGRIERLQNFVVKAFYPRINGVRKISLDACYGVEVLHSDHGEVTVLLVDELGETILSRCIPPNAEVPSDSHQCTEIIVENGFGNTVHRWVHGGGRAKRPPNVEAVPLQR